MKWSEIALCLVRVFANLLCVNTALYFISHGEPAGQFGQIPLGDLLQWFLIIVLTFLGSCFSLFLSKSTNDGKQTSGTAFWDFCHSAISAGSLYSIIFWQLWLIIRDAVGFFSLFDLNNGEAIGMGAALAIFSVFAVVVCVFLVYSTWGIPYSYWEDYSNFVKLEDQTTSIQDSESEGS